MENHMILYFMENDMFIIMKVRLNIFWIKLYSFQMAAWHEKQKIDDLIS